MTRLRTKRDVGLYFCNFDILEMIAILVHFVQDKAWFWFGRVLAVANLVYFSINLFGFLIPRFLPRAFKRYFQERGEIYAKAAEDKPRGVINKSHVPQKKSINLCL